LGLPPKPALASSGIIEQVSDQLTTSLALVRQTVTGSGRDRVAVLLMTLDGVPDSLVTTSDAYPDVPPLSTRPFPMASLPVRWSPSGHR
jgi:hypothetical protein